MPTLPRSIEPQVQVRNDRQAQRFNRASNANPVAEATQNAANAVNQIAIKIQEGRTAAEMAKSDIELRDELDVAYREIEADTETDPADFETTYEKRAKEIIASKAGNIRGTQARSVWSERAEELRLQKTMQVRDLTRTRQVEGVKSEAMNVGATYKRLAEDPATDSDTLQEAKQMYESLISVNEKNGIFDKVEAEALRIELDETSRASTSMRHTANVDALVDSGRVGEAEAYFKANDHEILPDQREAMEDALRSKSRVSEAVDTADRFMARAEGDYGAALLATRDIEDTDMRLAVEDRINTMRIQNDQAESAKAEAASDDAWAVLSEGGSVASMPSSVWKSLDGRERVQIQDWERRKREDAQRASQMSAMERQQIKMISGVSRNALSADRATDPEMYLSGPDVWKEESPNMFADWQRMTAEDQMKVRLDIQERRAKGQSVDTVDKAFKDVIGLVEYNLPAKAKPANYDTITSTNPDKHSDHERAIRGYLREFVTEHVQRTGESSISPDMAKVMIARAYQAYKPEKFPMSTDAGVANFRLRGGSEALMSRAQSIARERLGREPLPGEVSTVYNQLMEEASRE